MASSNGNAAHFYAPFIAYAIHANSPDFTPASLLAGRALEKYQDLTTNGCWYYAYANFLDRDDSPVFQLNWNRSLALQQLDKLDELGSQAIDRPLLIIGGGADKIVTFDTLRDVAQKACRNGIALTFRAYPELDHDQVMTNSTPYQLAWIKDRFAGESSPNNCAALMRSNAQ